MPREITSFDLTTQSVSNQWLRIVVAVAYVCGILMSPHLWFGFGRSFPRTPIFSGLAFNQDFLFAIALVVTLVLSAIKSDPRRYLAASVVLSIVLVLLDQARLQPWVYQYAIMLSLLVFAGAADNRAIVIANQLVVAMLYFWSGLQKLSWTFVHEVVPTLSESAGVYLAPRYLTMIALTIGIGETLIGVGLLFRRTRRVAVIAACVMHSTILLVFVITRRNTVIWPWNVAMIIITIKLFFRHNATPFEHLKRFRANRGFAYHLPKVALLICGLLPALSFVGCWDLYLSGALYSGKSPVAVMRINENLHNQLPAGAKQVVFTTSRGELMLPFYEWSLADLNVPPYPELRVYRQIARQLCTLDSEQQTNALIVRGRPALRDGNYQVTLTTCADLLSQ